MENFISSMNPISAILCGAGIYCIGAVFMAIGFAFALCGLHNLQS